MPEKDLKIQLCLDAGTALETETFGMDLKRDLDELPNVDVTIGASTVPIGAKGFANLDWSQILLTVGASSGVLTALSSIIGSRINRERKATLVIGKDRLELSGLREADQRKLIEHWLERKREGS